MSIVSAVKIHPAYDEVIDGLSWQELVQAGLNKMMSEYISNGELERLAHHIRETPKRFTASLEEYFSGYKESPDAVLSSFEEGDYNQMIFINDIPLISHCMHHLVAFAGKAHFAYIPNGKIVGLSKVPRLVDIYSRRMQIQEQLSEQVVNKFAEKVNPSGCGIIIEAIHLCICARGIKKPGVYTRTTALRGNFLEEKTKNEFLSGAVHLQGNLL